MAPPLAIGLEIKTIPIDFDKQECLSISNSKHVFFRTAATPTVALGLAILPLTQKHVMKFDRAQTRMFPSILGWVRDDAETCEETMCHMKRRFETTQYLSKIQGWSQN